MLVVILAACVGDPAIGPGEVGVVVARHHLAPGVALRKSDVRVMGLPPELVASTVLQDVDGAVGRIPRQPLLPAMQLMEDHLVPAGAAEGPQSLLESGERLVRVEMAPSPLGQPGDRADVVSSGSKPCIVAEGLRVIAGERDGTLTTDTRQVGPYPVLHLAVPVDKAAAVSDLASPVRVWARHPTDLAPLDPALPRCEVNRLGFVGRIDTAPLRVAPNGQAQVRSLLQGENAFVARLSLAPGGRVPVHRDSTEEYLVILEGDGILRMDGQEHAVSAGSVVYMPAHAEVSFVNGDQELVALQVFAGPGPAAKYDRWTAQ